MSRVSKALTAYELARRRGVLKRFGHLLELSDEVDRNASDSQFSGRRSLNSDFQGKIYYVFDENVFELFLSPADKWAYCANFYADVWGGGDEQMARHYSAKAGMIAAEFLFSGALPGMSPGDPVFMTPWHYGELKRRLYLLRGSFAKRAREQGDNHQTVQQYRDEDERYIHLESDQSPADQFKRALDRASPQTRRDALRFVEITKDYTAALRFLSARALAPRLVEDTVIEPLEQLKWLYSDVMAQVRTLELPLRAQGQRQGLRRAQCPD